MKDLSAWWYRICETLGFLRKVYGILTAQLLITVLIGAVCITVPQVRATVQGRYVQKAPIVVDITHSHINTKSILVISCTHTYTCIHTQCPAEYWAGHWYVGCSCVAFLQERSGSNELHPTLDICECRMHCPLYIVCDILHNLWFFSQTILEGLSLGIVVTYFDVDLVLKAFVITTAVFIGLTAYTMQSKYDFSTWGAR